jgi:dienelactone hydrolase
MSIAVSSVCGFVVRLYGLTTVACFCAVLSLTFVACGHDSDSEPGAPAMVVGEPVTFHPAASGATRFGDVPWPSDLYLGTDGLIGAVPGLERIAATPTKLARGLAALDGFGRSTGALFFLDAEVDPQSLPRTWEAATARNASVFIADVDDASSKRGARYPAYAKYLPTLGCISVIPVPGIVLPPGVRHAVVLSVRARSTNGSPLVADTELVRIAAQSAAARSTAVEHLYGSALDRLVASGAVARKNEVASLAVFTTSRQVFELPLLRARLRQQPEPELILDGATAAPYTVAVFGVDTQPSLDDWLGTPDKDENGYEWPGGDNPGGIAHDQIAVIASGAFVAPSFLDRITHHFERSASSGAIALADPDARIPFTLVIPKGAVPPAGYPVVIHGHGLSNHRGSMLGVANELARAGYAMIAIDDVLHGARQSIKDQHNNYQGSYDGPDGIPDGVGLPIAFFGGFSDFVALRDNFRQTVLDETSLVRLIQSSQLDLARLAAAAGGTTPRLDPQRIYWSGGSLGGIMGAMTIAVEPEIRAAALQVPGASFIQLITTSSAQLAPLVSTLARAALGVQGNEALDEFHPVATLLAAVTEAGDPIAYAPHVFQNPLLPERTPPDVLVSYAVYDEVLPNISTVALVRALGLALASPRLFDLPGIATLPAPVVGNLMSGRTGAAVQYLPANHGLGYARYDTRQFFPNLPTDGAERPRLPAQFTFEQPLREHLQQLVTFLDAVANGGPGRIEVTAPARGDYDGDGVLDDDEQSKGTDPYDPASH